MPAAASYVWSFIHLRNPKRACVAGHHGPLTCAPYDVRQVTDTAVLQAVKRCTFLQAVDVGCCARLTSVALAAILRSCSRLQLLRVGCVGTPARTRAVGVSRGDSGGLSRERGEGSLMRCVRMGMRIHRGCACSDRAAHAALKTLRTRLNDVDPPAQWEDHWDNPEFQQPIAAPSLRAMHWPGVDERAQQRLRTTCPRIRLTGQHEPGAAAAAATASSEDMVIYLPRNSILSAPSLAAAAAAGGAVRLRRRENIDEDDFWGSEASSESDVDGERDGAAAAVRGVREAGRVRQFARGERERGGAVMRHADAHGDDRSRADDASTGLRPERCRQSGRLSGRLLDPHVKLDEVVLRALGLRLEDGGGKRADGDAERQAADGELHIAERFRLAFDSRRERRADARPNRSRGGGVLESLSNLSE